MYHTVQKGESLWRICKAYGADVQEVAELNNIQDPSKIKAGDRIFIPGATQVKRTAQVQKPSLEKKETEKEIEPQIVLQPGLFLWPVSGKVVQEYGIINNQKHDGITIQASPGAPVYAAASGKVVFADFLQGYGNTIIINHPENFATVYAYVKSIFVKQGQVVKKGDKIAEVGVSGPSGQPALQFQIRKNNEPRNPLFYLPR